VKKPETGFTIRKPAFVAIDFETANEKRNSACSVGIVVCRDDKVIQKQVFLIRPPSSRFTNTAIHQLTWRDVETEPTFEQLWPKIAKFLANTNILVAHNAAFDKSVLKECCEFYNIPFPDVPWICTYRDVAVKKWPKPILPNHQLKTVCRHHGIELNHHEALSDALAVAEIIFAAQREGWSFPVEF